MEKQISLLWITPFSPYRGVKHAGGKTCAYYFDKIKETKSFDIRFISFGKESEKNAIESYFQDIVHFIYYRPVGFRKIFSQAKNISQKFNPFDRYGNVLAGFKSSYILKIAKKLKKTGFIPKLIILEWTEVVMLSRQLKSIFPDSKIIANELDVSFIGYRRKVDFAKGIFKTKAKFLLWNEMRHEIDSLKYCDHIFVQNPDNKEELTKLGLSPNNITWLVPFFSMMKSCQREPNSKDILFFGAMDRSENSLSCIWFIDNVLPLLADIHPRFVILGNNPSKELLDRESDNVHITGFVDSIQPFFEKARCFVAPLVLGAGIKVKVLESMSSGIPVLTNSIGIEGIHAKPNEEYLHCEKPEEYASLIKKVFYDKEWAEKVGFSGKMFINENFSYEQSSKDVILILKKL